MKIVKTKDVLNGDRLRKFLTENGFNLDDEIITYFNIPSMDFVFEQKENENEIYFKQIDNENANRNK